MNSLEPFERPEESGSGRWLTVLLVVCALGGAAWLFLGQRVQDEPDPRPAPKIEAKSLVIDGQRWLCVPEPRSVEQ